MKRCLAVTFAIASVIAAPFLSLAPVSAQQTLALRTFVSGTGDDGGTCSRTIPCRTFAAAQTQTLPYGEINCIDAGGFGGNMIIFKSLTIDCQGAGGGVSNAQIAGTQVGITISFDNFDPSDTHKQVILRGLRFQGLDDGEAAILVKGDGAGSSVSIEDCVINGNYYSTATGILDQRTRGALIIDNTTVRNNGANGIWIANTSSGSHRAVITNTHVINSAIGINVGLNANVVVSHSVVSNNATAGLMLAPDAILAVDSTIISHNGYGIQNNAGSVVSVSNSDFILNTTAIAGYIVSFSNNRFVKNTNIGGAVLPASTTASPIGQQ
jgi:parallel beta helix pectate lyase-like protein